RLEQGGAGRNGVSRQRRDPLPGEDDHRRVHVDSSLVHELQVDTHQLLADGHLVALLDEGGEPLPSQVDGLETDVDQDLETGGSLDGDAVAAGKELLDAPVHRGDHVRFGGVHRQPVPQHLLGEDRVVDHLEGDDPAGERAGDGGHDPSMIFLISASMLSAWGPRITCMALPMRITPNAPAWRSAASSTLLSSETSTRMRVTHGSISVMFSLPPSPASTCSACSRKLIYVFPPFQLARTLRAMRFQVWRTPRTATA